MELLFHLNETLVSACFYHLYGQTLGSSVAHHTLHHLSPPSRFASPHAVAYHQASPSASDELHRNLNPLSQSGTIYEFLVKEHENTLFFSQT